MEITMVQEILLHEDSLASQKHLLEPDYLTDYLQMKQYEVSGEDKKEIKNILEYPRIYDFRIWLTRYRFRTWDAIYFIFG